MVKQTQTAKNLRLAKADRQQSRASTTAVGGCTQHLDSGTKTVVYDLLGRPASPPRPVPTDD